MSNLPKGNLIAKHLPEREAWTGSAVDMFADKLETVAYFLGKYRTLGTSNYLADVVTAINDLTDEGNMQVWNRLVELTDRANYAEYGEDA